jgi:superfamily II DNA or RNA helicase
MSNTEGPRRDPRRLFSSSQRTHIASRQHWACDECGRDISDGIFHAHHVIPWADGGPTETDNGVAVCPDCHQHATIHQLPAFTARRWQNAALPKILPKLRHGEFATLSAAPGAGKTLFTAWTYRQLSDSGDVARLVVFVPNSHLRTQWADEVKALSVFLGTKGTTEKASYDGVVLNYHALSDPVQAQQIIDDADEQPTLFVLDEVHHLAQRHGGEAGAWAVNIARIVGTVDQPRHRVLNLSGTLFRSNPAEQISTIQYQRLETGQIETLADYAISAGQLIEEKQLRHIKVLGFDADMRVEAVDIGRVAHDGAETIRAVDIDGDKEIRGKVLRAMIRDQRFIKGILRETLNRLGHASTALDGASVKGLVIADDIPHAEMIHAALTSEVGPRYAFIAHGKMATAEAEIERFRKSTGQAIMVAVQKVTEGFDVPDICVLTYLRSWRAPLFINQMIGRAMRITDREKELETSLPATVLVPNETEIKAAFADVLVGSMQVLVVPPEPCPACGLEICACPPRPRDKICSICRYPWYLCTCECPICHLSRDSGCRCRRGPVCGNGQQMLDLEVVSDGEVVDINVDGRHVPLHIVNVLRKTGAAAGLPDIYIEQQADAVTQAVLKDPMAFGALLRGEE